MANYLIETRGLTRRFGARVAVDILRVIRGHCGGRKYYPWLLPLNIFLEGRFTSAIVLGAGGGIVAVLIGCFEFVRRDVLS